MGEIAADVAMVDVLTKTLANDPTIASRPGQLRIDLVTRMGELASSYRPQIHQLVAAAEDGLPASLTRIAPLTSQSLLRLSEELASTRGWALATAERAIATWAVALGFGDLVASSWPREPLLPGRAAGIAPLPPTELPPRPAAQAPPSHASREPR